MKLGAGFACAGHAPGVVEGLLDVPSAACRRTGGRGGGVQAGRDQGQRAGAVAGQDDQAR